MNINQDNEIMTDDMKNVLEKMRIRYEKKVIKNELGCWSFKNPRHCKDYGSITGHPYWPMMTLNRASWIIHNGLIPKGLFVCHHCDNPNCTRPDHLFLGTAKDNKQDWGRKVQAKYLKMWTDFKEELNIKYPKKNEL